MTDEGTFETVHTEETEWVFYWDVRSGDLTGDGQDEVVLANSDLAVGLSSQSFRLRYSRSYLTTNS